MSDLRRYGSFTRLTRVVVADGARRFTHAAQFDAYPDGPAVGDYRIIMTGVVDADVASGVSSAKTVIWRRGLHASSYNEAEPPPAHDVPFSYLGGTNMVACHAAWAHVWPNSAAVSGLRSASRIRRGDVLIWNGKHALVVDCEACASPGAGGVEWQDGVFPGRAPIMAGTKNLATPDSIDVNENVLNHRDVTDVADPRGEFAPPDGAQVDVARRPVFHPLHPPTFQYAVKGGAWATLPSEAYYLLAEEGILLLDEDWTNTFTAGTILCFRYVGKRFRQTSTLPARGYNDIVNLLEAADGLYIRVGIGASTTSAISGFIGWGVGPSKAFCAPDPIADPPGSTSMLVVSEYVVGNNWNFWLANGVVVGGDTVYPPYFGGDPAGYIAPTTVPEYFGEETACDVGSFDLKNLYTEWAGVCLVRNWASLGGTLHGKENWIRSIFGYDWAYHSFLPSASFSFGGIPWDPADLLRAIPEGSTIIEAHATIQINGLVSYTEEVWAGWDNDDAGDSEYYTKAINGVIVRDYAITKLGVVDPNIDLATDNPTAYAAAITPVPGAPIRWSLMGIRRDTRDEVDVYGYTIPDIPSHRFGHLGCSVEAEAGDGVTHVVDITAPIQELVDQRDSTWSSFMLWPQKGGAGASATSEGLVAYVDNLKPSCDISGTITAHSNVRAGHGMTKEIAWDSLVFVEIEVKFMSPEGVLARRVFPKITPATRLGTPGLVPGS